MVGSGRRDAICRQVAAPTWMLAISKPREGRRSALGTACDAISFHAAV
jgi:hypothetical protein